MNKEQKVILYRFILAAAMLLIGLFIGRETKICKTGSTIINTRVDTIVAVVPAVSITDTLYKFRTKYLPGDVDSTLVNLLFEEREELTRRLDSMKVRSVVEIDTLYGPYQDTLRLTIDDFRDTFALYLGISPRPIHYEVKTVYMPAPKREWWNNPYAGAGAGIVAGFILGALK